MEAQVLQHGTGLREVGALGGHSQLGAHSLHGPQHLPGLAEQAEVQCRLTVGRLPGCGGAEDHRVAVDRVGRDRCALVNDVPRPEGVIQVYDKKPRERLVCIEDTLQVWVRQRLRLPAQ